MRSLLALLGLLLAAGSAADDWPQWRGPSRDGVSAETGLADDWRETPPRELWRVSLGAGYSGIAVAGERLYTLYSDATDEYAAAFDTTGRRLWRLRLDSRYTDNWGDGPRATPTVVGERVYVVGARGELACLDAASGEALWRRDLYADFGGEVPDLGYSSSPLVEDGRLFLPVGDGDENAFVALDPRDGRLLWKAHDDQAGYSSPLAVTIAGRRQVVFYAGTSIAALAPGDGALLWRAAAPNSSDENVATPIFQPPDRLFFSAAHEGGARLLRIAAQNGGLAAETVWKSRVMKNHFSSCVLYRGTLYGSDRSILKAVDVADGTALWQTRGFGEGSLLAADGHLYVLGTSGQLSLVEATPEAFREKGSTNVLRRRAYTPPSLARGRLYLRDHSDLVCLDVRRPR